MDHFFASVACLMSNNLRSAVYASLHDLLQFVEAYKHGNDYDGDFVRSLPVLSQLLILSVVSIGDVTRNKSQQQLSTQSCWAET